MYSLVSLTEYSINGTRYGNTRQITALIPLLKLLEGFACTLMLPATFIMIF